MQANQQRYLQEMLWLINLLLEAMAGPADNEARFTVILGLRSLVATYLDAQNELGNPAQLPRWDRFAAFRGMITDTVWAIESDPMRGILRADLPDLRRQIESMLLRP